MYITDFFVFLKHYSDQRRQQGSGSLIVQPLSVSWPAVLPSYGYSVAATAPGIHNLEEKLFPSLVELCPFRIFILKS